MKLKKGVKIFILIIIILLSTTTYFLLTKDNPEEKGTTPTSTFDEQSELQSVKLTFVGDLLFEDPYYNAIKNGEEKDLYFSKVRKYFDNDDITVGNLEVVIGNASLISSGSGYNFCAPEWIADIIKNESFEVLSTANNHAFDRGKDGIISTINHFKDSSITTIGSYLNEEDRNKQTIIEKNGIRVGFLSYTMSTNVKPNNDELYLISYYKSPTKSNVTENDYNNLKKDIEKLKKEVDITIILIHWGKEFTYEVDNIQKELANFFSELNIDIVVGSHAHNIQPMEWINNTLVFYGMGNFVSADDDIPRTTEEFNNAYQMGLLSQVTIKKENNTTKIDQVTTEPIINYYDKDLRNFMLIPKSEYTTKYETTHMRYSKNFNNDFINNLYTKLIPEEFR